MPMKITDRLKAEHGVFLCQLDHLQDLVRREASLEVLEAVAETIASAEERHVITVMVVVTALGVVLFLVGNRLPK